MDKKREKFEVWINYYFEYHIDLSKSKNGDYINQQTHDMWQACKSRDKEIKRLRGALDNCLKNLKTAMFGYRKEANRMPNYDLAESALWEMFDNSVARAEEILKDGE